MKAFFLQGGNVFSPEALGKKDLFIMNSQVAALGAPGDFKTLGSSLGECEILDVSDCYVIPGFIDQHVHLNGGGGEGGPRYRTPPLQVEACIRAGVTTAVGLLGTDGITRSLEELLMKARALEAEGITTYIHTGAYDIPSPTLTGSISRDIVLIDKVLGLKIALADHRSSRPTFEELARVSAQAKMGGLLAGKAGIVTVHVGSEESKLQDLFDLVEKAHIPITQFVPTHLTRNRDLLKDALRFGKAGGYIDLTAEEASTTMPETAEVIKELLGEGLGAERVTVSSDGNGSMPQFDDQGNLVAMGIGSIDGIYTTLVSLVKNYGVDMTTAVRVSATNVAEHLLFHTKGRIQEGMDADLVVLEPHTLALRHVMAKGVLLMKDGVVVHKGTFA